MKKNAMLKIAAILLVAVLLTTCAISTTFAKYVTATEEKEAEIARVADWGLKITMNGAETFAPDYGTDPAKLYVQAKTSSRDDLVAPGTESKADMSVTLIGAPEVAYKLTATADVQLEGWAVTSGVYCPLVIKVNTTEYKINTTDVTTTDALEAKVENAILDALLGADATKTVSGEALTGSSVDYAPNTDVTTVTDDIKISWYWPLSVSEEYDAKDTELGDAAEKATISIAYSLGAEQVGLDRAPAYIPAP